MMTPGIRALCPVSVLQTLLRVMNSYLHACEQHAACPMCSDSKMDDISIVFHRSYKCGDPVNATFGFTVMLMLVPALLYRVVTSTGTYLRQVPSKLLALSFLDSVLRR